MILSHHDLDIGYQFKKSELLEEALTHKSYSIEENRFKPHNERLEFLGDSLLNCIIAADLIQKLTQEDEGVLSKKRASLVNQNTLAILAHKIKIQDYILFGPGEIKQGSALNPRILASALEAIIGAIYLDSDFIAVQKWTLKLFKNVPLEIYDQVGFNSDYKTRLQELTQKYKLGTPIYKVVHTSGPSHKPIFIVSLLLDSVEKARADGTSKKAAEQKAAEIYLTELQKLNLNRQPSHIGDK